jgi:hypothetical protein
MSEQEVFLTPEQLYVHAKALWPKTTHVSFDEKGLLRHSPNFNGSFSIGATVDWGDLTQWPQPEPVEQWRDAVMPQDWGKPCRFKLHDDYKEWGEGEITGFIPREKMWYVFTPERRWNVKVCQVRVEPEKANENCTKPLLGILPRWRHREYRIEDLEAVIARFTNSNQEPKAEWIEELNELTKQPVAWRKLK